MPMFPYKAQNPIQHLQILDANTFADGRAWSVSGVEGAWHLSPFNPSRR
jgi:hypothetical protein